MKYAVIVPTLNAQPWLSEFLAALDQQTLVPDEVLFIDSSSEDNTVRIIEEAGYPVHIIPREEFNHGGTRGLATKLVSADIYIYLTQDAILASKDALLKLCSGFDDPEVGVVYGRQLPNKKAGILGAHARLFNYPGKSEKRSIKDSPTMGIKACFVSDSYAAYRITALEQVGGFPNNVIGTEDAFVAARMLISGWKASYIADSCVYHSHDYTLRQQLQRYFDIGVFYGRESWIADTFGRAGGEGLKFVKSEFRYLLNAKAFWVIPYALMQNAVKIFGYKMGKLESHLGMDLKRHLSMNRNFWAAENDAARR